jgi:hypothetical protein
MKETVDLENPTPPPRPAEILVPTVFLVMMFAPATMAGRNANGALIVHTDDAVNYTVTDDYCQSSFLPASCEAAITRPAPIDASRLRSRCRYASRSKAKGGSIYDVHLGACSAIHQSQCY